jgi:hypothetical protein
LAAQKKEEKDAAKKRQVWKALEQEAMRKCHRQQSLDGLPLKESPSEMVSGEDDDNDDDDAESQYDTTTSLAHLPDVRPFLEPIGGRPPRRRGKPWRPLRGRESQETEGLERVLWREELPRLGPCKRGRWRRSREPKHLGLSRWSKQRRRRQKPGHRRRA